MSEQENERLVKQFYAALVMRRRIDNVCGLTGKPKPNV